MQPPLTLVVALESFTAPHSDQNGDPANAVVPWFFSGPRARDHISRFKMRFGLGSGAWNTRRVTRPRAALG
jgi:hypothetical protein